MSKTEDIMKRAVVAGASRALRYKERHPAESESDILKKVMADMRTIIEEIDRE
jgi:hypothetical protein